MIKALQQTPPSVSSSLQQQCNSSFITTRRSFMFRIGISSFSVITTLLFVITMMMLLDENIRLLSYYQVQAFSSISTHIPRHTALVKYQSQQHNANDIHTQRNILSTSSTLLTQGIFSNNQQQHLMQQRQGTQTRRPSHNSFIRLYAFASTETSTTLRENTDTLVNNDSTLFTSSTERLLLGADNLLNLQKQQSMKSSDRTATSNNKSQDAIGKDGKDDVQSFTSSRTFESTNDDSATTRRMLFASALFAAGTVIGTSSDNSNTVANAAAIAYAMPDSQLQFKTTPVNKRTGVTLFDAERNGYNVRFVTYLSRFLLNFDNDCQRWWYSRGSNNIPRLASQEQIIKLREEQFAAFSASVEVGLQEYGGSDGPATLLEALVKRYCPSLEDIQATREAQNLAPLSKDEREQKERTIKEARRQIALLFALMDSDQQPTAEITKLLAAIDNGSITSVEIVNPGAGYAPGYGPPNVVFPPPAAGEGYETATGRATLTPNGRILRVDVVNRGAGYAKPPTVTIAPPAAIRFATFDNSSSVEVSQARTAQAQAFLFRKGPNKGRVERIQLVDPGAGYTKSEIIRVRVSPPEVKEGGVTATATAILEYQVAGIEMVKNGTGYAVEKPVQVYVEPPPPTARINMNDPYVARLLTTDKLLPATSIPSPSMKSRMSNATDPTSLANRIAFEALAGGKGGGGGCIGRACYDPSVVAVAYPRAEKDSYSAYRSPEEAALALQREREITAATATSGARKQPYIGGTVSGNDNRPPPLPGFGGRTSSAQLLTLLPAGVGLEFRNNRYVIALDPSFPEIKAFDESERAFDPDFGPRGRSPIERDMELGIATYLRFIASGAICCSGVHLALTPIDVVKTKVQTNPRKYPNMMKGFKKVLAEGGTSSFFTGWAPTFAGFFVWGGVSYALTEFLRRYLTDLAGADAAGLDVPIILTASAVAAFFGSFVLCPFESVRIRSVAQPGYGKNILQVIGRMVNEEGLFSLFKAVPAFCAKEIPFAMGKFTVFDLSTKWMYEQFPIAREDLQLSLLVSLIGGSVGGLVAAIVSNPADATISEMKKAASGLGAVKAFQKIVDEDGPAALFRGLPLRMIFYPLLVSLQFLVYDSVRIALGIGSDDLKLYLDVLGGALTESGGPV